MRTILWLTFASIYQIQAQTSSPTGILSGNITDKKAKEPVSFATIQILGTYSAAQSDIDGNYKLLNLKPGVYSIKFSFVGYSDKIYHQIKIVGGQTTTLYADLTETSMTLGEVEVVGDKGSMDLESGKSEFKITASDIKNTNLRDVKELATMQTGVTLTPDGLQIRGGRVYETQYLVEGISAQDPLSGTGFGVNVAGNAIEELKVNTSGSDAENGGGTAGTVSAKIREGGKSWKGNVAWIRDNLGFQTYGKNSWNTDIISANKGGPIPFTKNKLTLFTSIQTSLTDQYFGRKANQLHSSTITDPFWTPRYDNAWSMANKLAWNVRKGTKITYAWQGSLAINQNTRALQIVGFDAIVQPGFQYPFSLNLDNATTYTHSSQLHVLTWKQVIKPNFFSELSLGRMFSTLRADANGLPFRSETVDRVYDPQSIVTDPVQLFNPDYPVVYVLPGPGLYNNNGIGTTWHDHSALENTIKYKFTYNTKSKIHEFGFGQEHKFIEYQWVDVSRPWIGAPIKINDQVSTPSTSIGSSSDVWRVKPQEGAFFFQDEIRYKGIIATLGFRLAYWAPGSFVDKAVADPKAPVVGQIRQDYNDQTVDLLGLAWKQRLLPKLRVSFPITENQVMYVNYAHSMRLPHPRFVYAGLDPVYQDRGTLANLGNPNLNPEVLVSYELGVKSKLTGSTSMAVSAFYNDRFDYIVSRDVYVEDASGRLVPRNFSINQDYARIRGLEVTLFQNIGKEFKATFSTAYQVATGKSNSASESAIQIKKQGFVQTSKEQFLAWDTPWNIKLMLTYTPDSARKLFGAIPLKGCRFFVGGYFKTGLRYTPQVMTGTSPLGRDLYESIQNQPYAKIGTSTFTLDFRFNKDIVLRKNLNLTLSFEIKNLTDTKNAQVINPVTGAAYELGDPLPRDRRDPTIKDPQDDGLPPLDPARYMAPRQFLFGIALGF